MANTKSRDNTGHAGGAVRDTTIKLNALVTKFNALLTKLDGQSAVPDVDFVATIGAADQVGTAPSGTAITK